MSVEAVLRSLGAVVGKAADEEEATCIKEKIRMALKWVSNSGAEESPWWIVPPGTEVEKRKRALTAAQRLVEEAQRRVPGAEGAPKGERHSWWRGLRKGRDGQMQFVLERKGRRTRKRAARKDRRGGGGKRTYGTGGERKGGGRGAR